MRRPAIVLALVLLATVLVGGWSASPVAASPQVPASGRISVTSSEAQIAEASFVEDITPNGRFVLFTTDAPGVTGDTNGETDVYLRDTVLGTTQRVSVSSGEAQGDDRSLNGSISDDGRFVAFTSEATNFDAGHAPAGNDVFLRDRTLGTTELVSDGLASATPDGESGNPAISGDGTKVAFSSQATNLVAGDTLGHTDIFLRDLTADTTERVSVTTTEGQADANSIVPDIDQNGDVVVFLTSATNLIGVNDTNGFQDAYARQLASGTTIRVSVGVGGVQGDGATTTVSVNDAGNQFGFESAAENLVPEDANEHRDVFHRSIQLGGTVERVSVDPAGGDLDGDSSGGTISSDGTAVVFETEATDVGAGQDNGVLADVVVRDVTTDTTTLASRRTGVVVDGNSFDGRLTDDGRVAFTSDASNLVPGDTNGTEDVFLSGEVCDGRVVNVNLAKGQAPTALADVILGTPSEDTVDGLAGNDRFCGLSGNDVFRGGAGNDRAFGYAGRDDLKGQAGNDRLDGGTNNDTLLGGDQNDVLLGVSGADLLEGGNGRDNLNGGFARDTCRGQAGTDTATACEVITGVP